VSVPDLDQPVVLHALTFLDEGDEVTVGRPDTDSYCVLPADGANLLRELARGVPPSEAASWYARQYGQPVDMVDFLGAMAELDFLAAPGEEPVTGAQVRWQRLGRAMFGPAAWCGYALVVGAGVVAMAREPALLPRYGNLFYTPYLTLVVLTLFFGQLGFALFHEWFHTLAGRQLGLRSRISVGRRLYYVVFETALDGLTVAATLAPDDAELVAARDECRTRVVAT
jgi:hypothetical protein